MTSCTLRQSAVGAGGAEIQMKLLPLLLLDWHVHCYLNEELCYLPLEYAACETFDLDSGRQRLPLSHSVTAALHFDLGLHIWGVRECAV